MTKQRARQMQERGLEVRRAARDEGRGRARLLYRDGFSVSFISMLLDISEATVCRYLGPEKGDRRKGNSGRPRKSQI